MDNVFYVYVYLDQRKPGNFIYGNYIFEYEPFYIGKGKDKRQEAHLLSSKLLKNGPKNNKIKKIIRETGEIPISYRLAEKLSEEQANTLEIKLIQLIGRKDLKQGVLLNLTDGGEGCSGRIFTTEAKKVMRSHRLGKKASEETKKKSSESHKGLIKSVETLKKLSDRSKKPVISIDKNGTELYFSSVTEAATFYNVTIATIWNNLKNKVRTKMQVTFYYVIKQS